MNKLLSHFLQTKHDLPLWADKYPKVYVFLMVLFLLLSFRLMANFFSNSIDIFYGFLGLLFFIMGALSLYKFLRQNKFRGF